MGELPLATQARLLRVLETGEYIRVGGTKIMKTDVRIVAATNVNMQKAITEGRFREDLYYRLNTIPIQMPPLRDRGNDILLLFRLFAMQMAEKYRQPKITLSEDAKQIMLGYKWPGNVRQLNNITEQMSVLSQERIIDVETLKRYIPQDPESMQLAIAGDGGSHSFESEREILYKILYELRGNVSDLRRELNDLKKQMKDQHSMLNTPAPARLAPAPARLRFVDNNYHQPEPTADFIDAEEVTTDKHHDEAPASNDNLNLKDFNRKMIEKALERNNGNRRLAAAELGISDRTLYRSII